MTQTIDKRWFFKQLEAQRKSVRGLARHLDMDASAVSRMFSGQRKMPGEATVRCAADVSLDVTLDTASPVIAVIP